MMIIVAIASLLWSLALSQGQPEIAYLRGVPRQNDSSLMDYYFSCNGVGPRLFWEVNSDLFGFTGDRSIGDTTTLVTAELRSFATLLFTSRVDNSTFRYSSVLIVTSRNRIGHVPLFIRCFTGRLVSAVTNNDSLATAKDNSFVMKLNGNLYLDYMFTAYVVNETLPTYVYSCGVNDNRLAWLASGTATFVFRNTSMIGDNTQTSSMNTVPELKLVLIASEPYELVAVVFATGIDAVNVTCASRQVTEFIYYPEVLAANSPEIPSETSMSTDGTPTPTTTPSPPCNRTCVITITIVVVVVVVLAIILFIAGASLLWYCCCYMKKDEIVKKVEVHDIPIRSENPLVENKIGDNTE